VFGAQDRFRLCADTMGLERAAQLLRTTNLPIAEIACRFDATPRAFRLRADEEAPA
jgi:hypothetical protein